MPKSKELKFEQALSRLEQIVNQLETKEASLEDSLSLFEEGVQLARLCQKRLEEAKHRVEILSKETGTILPYEKEAES